MDKNNSLIWAEKARELIEDLKIKENKRILKASVLIADSIEKGHVTFMFGSGHSVIPVEETFPRYGGMVGYLPIIEMPLSFFTTFIGNLGFSQFDVLENNEAYGSAIMKNYIIHESDSMIVYSHSGSTPVTMQVAMDFKGKGGKLISVINESRTKSSKSKHSSGKTLMDVSDVVINNQCPISDVSLNISNVHVGPLSSIATISISNMITISAVEILIERGIFPTVNPVRGVDSDVDNKMDTVLSLYRKILTKHLA